MCASGVDEGTCRRRSPVTRQLKCRWLLNLGRERRIREVRRKGWLWVFEGR